MSVADCINGTFEAVGGLFLLVNCRRVVKDKGVKGVSIISTAFFAAWGIWNCWFYPSLAQWVSFSGGLLIVVANIAWIALMIYYSRKPQVKTCYPTQVAVYAPCLRCRVFGHSWWICSYDDSIDERGRRHRHGTSRQMLHCQKCGVANPDCAT